jgi:hypothetical protein
MKSTINKFLAVLFLATGTFISAKAQVTKDEIQLVQSIWGMEKRQIVTDFMALSPAEAEKFFVIYDKFSMEMKKLGEERLMIISEYGVNYSKMTNEKADELITRLMKNNTNVDKLITKYYAMFKKDLGGLTAAKYVQLELYLQTMMRAELQNNIPFIGELDKKAN